ncbi:lipopolysaccharide biosynthesis protein [Laspinema sp. D1]|uniref:Lipopolysaccharide biosynthesis protein n=1 Tax=Laspinema palackyanum D2a TaxID=2953684 RepID=A0ABT2MMH6_9CYAN|nr:lipopolysaccharide biosynthesis protein [Laspinema sp. D2a]
MSDPIRPTPKADDPQRYFSTDHLEVDLKDRSIRSGLVTAIAQASKFILLMGSNIVLARLLVPEDYGLLAMVLTVTSFVAMFKDMGLSTATIQQANITHNQVSNLFWINVALGFGIGLLNALVSPIVAWFYQEPRLIGITIVLGIGFVFSGLTVQHQALLRRQMRFGVLAAIEVTALASGIGSAIVLASYGSGYWSLVMLNIVTDVLVCAGVWLGCGWRPGLPVRQSGVSSMLAFGGNLTGFNFFNFFSRNLDNVLIGWRWGAEPLGLYAKAYQLLLLPIQQINAPMTTVALPALSRLQSDPVRYRSYYCKGIRLMVSFGMPVVAFLLVVADKVIEILLGEQWLEIIPIFRLLGPSAFLGTLNMSMGWVYLSLGRTDRMLRWTLVASPLTIVSFLIGLPWGPEGVALSYSIFFTLLLVPGIMYCYQGSPLQLRDLVRAIARPMVASIGAALTLAGINLFLPSLNLFADLLRDCVLYGSFYILLWLAPPNGTEAVLEMVRVPQTLFSKKPQ